MPFYRDLNDDTPQENPNVLDVDAVVQGVRDLLLTSQNERLFEPDYGINVEDYLFELMDDTAALELFGEIVDAVRRYEPRVSLDLARSDVVTNEDENSFEITLYFTIKGFSGELYEVTESITR